MPGLPDILSVLSGSLVGFSLGLIGGGGSILAMPLMIYVVGVPETHVAIGSSALAVAASAAVNLAGHARNRTVNWSCALLFAAAGIVGAALGAQLGKMMDGHRLLFLFGVLMVAVGVLSSRPRKSGGDPGVRLERASAVRLVPLLMGIGLAVGALAGFFGIGGGFLIVPGLMAATGIPLINAIGSSLVCVTAFALTTATSYAISGLVDWRLAGLFILGGAIGGFIGIQLAHYLAGFKRALSWTFSGMVIGVGIYVIVTSLTR